MKEYIYSADVTVSAHTKVLANTKEEADEIVAAREVKIGGWGSGVDDTEVWVIGEADGKAQNIHCYNHEGESA